MGFSKAPVKENTFLIENPEIGCNTRASDEPRRRLWFDLPVSCIASGARLACLRAGKKLVSRWPAAGQKLVRRWLKAAYR